MLTKCLTLAGLVAAGALLITGCSKSSTTASTAPVLPAEAITTTTLGKGNVKGVMLADSTYTVNGSLTVLKGDTLTIQAGATIKMTGDYAVYVQGVIQSIGTQAKPVTITTSLTEQPGQWGGFQCDSAQAVTFYWTKLLWAGGPDPSSGNTTQTIAVKSPIPVDIEDCWLIGGQDNAIGVYSAATVKILRNTMYGNGTTDGDAIDFHSGATGVVAYNVLWGGAGSAIKIFTGTVQYPQTNIICYNNTCVDNGFRRGAGEPGRGIYVDAFAKATLYNNLLANNYWGLDFSSTSDYANSVYSHNYFYTTVDSLRAFLYAAGELGVIQSSDIIDSTVSGANNPMFVNYTPPPVPENRTIPSSYDFHLKSGSPALGKGYTGAVTLPTGAPALSADMGAYVSDTTGGKGNRH
jgi:hypothetical protein